MPGTYYVFVPLYSPQFLACKIKADNPDTLDDNNFQELLKQGENLIARLKNNTDREVCGRVITFASKSILKNLDEGDILYIVAHGNVSNIGTKSSAISLNPTRLANKLKRAGLSFKIKTIKLTTCDSAINKKNIDSSYDTSSLERPINVEEKSYLERFAEAMLTRGYQVNVAGYLGQVTDGISAIDGTVHSFCHFWRKTSGFSRF